MTAVGGRRKCGRVQDGNNIRWRSCRQAQARDEGVLGAAITSPSGDVESPADAELRGGIGGKEAAVVVLERWW